MFQQLTEQFQSVAGKLTMLSIDVSMPIVKNVPLLITFLDQFYAWVHAYMFWPIVPYRLVAISCTVKLVPYG